jgi:hypothetical protein
MRAHGVSNFPDPTGGGAIQFGDAGISPFSPAFRTAQKSCQHLLPNKGQPSQMTASERQAALKFAECMRTHGEPDFPDPSDAGPNGTGPMLSLHGMTFAVGPGLDPRSPAFQQAAARCGIKLPGKPLPRAGG